MPPARRAKRSMRFSKREAVYERILLDIICRELPSGTSLNEVSLARRYRTGRAGVRDALFRLSLEGLVKRWPRVGTAVADLSVFELQQSFEARMAVEVYCAGLASQVSTPEDLRTVREALVGWEDVLERRDFRALIRLDQQFHQGLAQATRNQALVRIVVMLHNNALRFWYHALPRRSLESARAGLESHVRVLGAVQNGDRAGAEQAMQRLLGQFHEAKGFLGSLPLSER